MSVIGLKESRRIQGPTGRRLQPRHSKRRFRFSDSVSKSLDIVIISLETPTGLPIVKVMLDVISADIHAILGMDMMDENFPNFQNGLK